MCVRVHVCVGGGGIGEQLHVGAVVKFLGSSYLGLAVVILSKSFYPIV